MELHQADDVDDTYLEVGQLLAEDRHGREDLQRDALGVVHGGFGVQPPRHRAFARQDDVDRHLASGGRQTRTTPAFLLRTWSSKLGS
jgi:hypothetical protein